MSESEILKIYPPSPAGFFDTLAKDHQLTRAYFIQANDKIELFCYDKK